MVNLTSMVLVGLKKTLETILDIGLLIAQQVERVILAIGLKRIRLNKQPAPAHPGA